MQFVNIPHSKYQMGAFQVTQEQWLSVMGYNNSHNTNGKDLPVENVSWNEVQEFLKKMNEKKDGYTYSLPTEQQWEYCCRAGSTTKWCFGDEEEKLQDYAWYYKNSNNKTHPVGVLSPNAWGLYDMHGNVWEMTSSEWSPGSSNRVVRGGSSWADAEFVRSAYRDFVAPGGPDDLVGFRVHRGPVLLSTVTLLPFPEVSEPVRKPGASDGCSHPTYLSYQGLFESFQYCKNCGDKKR